MIAAGVLSPRVELFVGQFVALLPTCDPDTVTAVEKYQLNVLFPRLMGGAVRASSGQLRPRVYSLTMTGLSEGILTAGGTDIAVRVLPLDVMAPAESTAFQVVAMSGRALRVRGIAEGVVAD